MVLKLISGVAVAAATAVALASLAAGSANVAGAATGRASSPKLHIASAENFWGSIVEQLAGKRGDVSSIITNPDTDPHNYEATPSDGRTIASADYVIENGIGYDTWAQKLIDANSDVHLVVLNVGKFLALKAGDNPHQWYSPTSVHAFIDRVTKDLMRLDRNHAGYYAQRRQAYLSGALKRYTSAIATIRQRYTGTLVGATESIVTPLAQALGLNLITPEKFLDAIAEGTDPTAKDKATVDQQIASNEIKVLMFNSQNATPDVKALVRQARMKHIPVTTVTETLTPAGASFQAWQTRQLNALAAALAKGP